MRGKRIVRGLAQTDKRNCGKRERDIERHRNRDRDRQIGRQIEIKTQLDKQT